MKNFVVIIVCLVGLSLSASAQCGRFLNYASGTQTGTSLAQSESYCGEKINLVNATYDQYSGICLEYAGAVVQAYYTVRGNSCHTDGSEGVNDDQDVCHATEEGHGEGCIEQ